MNNVRSLILSGTILSVFFASGAFAQNRAPAPQPETPAATESADPGAATERRGPLARFDTNKDGAIELEEFVVTERLKTADTNGDGTLSQDEIEAMALKRIVEREARKMTSRLDIDGDGTVTIAEVEKHKAKRFALMDRNDDGKLDRGEFRHGQKSGQKSGKGHHGSGHHERHGEHRKAMPKN
ncbi:MAG: EF-hand domain-containing protein [Phyllobacterium sp.]